MANLQSSGAISIANIKNLFGGPASPSFANYYRGGSYIPSTKTVSTLVIEPTGLADTRYGVTPVLRNGSWYLEHMYKGVWFITNTNLHTLWWNDSRFVTSVSGLGTSYSYGGYTYYMSSVSWTSQFSTSCYCYQWYAYGIRRTSGGSSTVSINTGIPSSGQISMNQFYGAEKP
jgi:hypothetical protein